MKHSAHHQPDATASPVNPGVDPSASARWWRRGPRPTAGANLGSGSRLQRAAAAFWLGHLFWSARYFPWYARLTQTFWIEATWFFSAGLRQTTLTNARRLAGPGATFAAQRRLARATIASFMQFIVDLGQARKRSPQQLRSQIARTVGQEYFEQAKAMGRGVIIATAHFGSFEIGIASLTPHARRVHVLFRPDPFANFQAVRAESRQQLGVVEYDVDQGLITWMKLRDALRQEEIVLIQADRAEPGQSGQAVPFFDGHIRVPTGPVRLAMMSGAPIVPAFSFRDHDNLVQIHLGKPILVSQELQTADGSDRVMSPDQALLEFTRQLETHVRLHPEQWLMLQPAWLEDQPASASASSSKNPSYAADPSIHPPTAGAAQRARSGSLIGDGLRASEDQALT